MTFRRSVVLGAVVALLLTAWMSRYSVVAGARLPFVLDRWTGEVFIAHLVDR